MRVFKMRRFVRFARSELIHDDALCEAIERAERGLIDADLGGGLVKQHVARPGQRRSGGYRVIVAYQPDRLAVFLYGFGKNERSNITGDELLSLRDVAAKWLEKDDAQIQQSMTEANIEEVHYGKETWPNGASHSRNGG